MRYIRSDDDDICFVLDQHAGLVLYSVSSLKQQSAGRRVAPLRQIILILSHSCMLYFMSLFQYFIP